jgi:hypothetical protein
MNTLTRSLYLLPAALLVMSCGREHEYGSKRANDSQVTITRSWPATEIEQLKVFEVDGSISVEAAPVDTISLVATARGNLNVDKNADNQGLFFTEVDGHTLKIGRKEKRRRGRIHIPFIFGKSRKRIDYVLRVPPAVSLDVTTVNGRIVTRGIEGGTEAVSVNGPLDLESAGTKELYATTVNGRVRARFLHSFNGAKFKTVNGGVEAILPNDASFNVDLSQVNGDFEASFPLSIRSNPGRRQVSGDVNGGRYNLKISTVNGDVQLARINGM